MTCSKHALLPVLACLPLLFGAAASRGAVFELREDGGGIFGTVETVETRYEDTLIELARRFSLGYEELTRVNPDVDPWLPGAGAKVLIPGQRVLPPGPREGVVVNLPEHRLYFFPKPKRGEKPVVMTFPVSVGKMDWRTPLGRTQIVQKRRNPAWYPPDSIRREHAARGEPLPPVVPPGPDNPLGAHAMRLGIPGGSYLIHGTNNPDAVGMAVTHGCLRMYPEDVARLFDAVAVGTPVTLISEPVKIAIVDGEVWLEVHPPVDAQGQRVELDLADFEQRLDAALGSLEVAIHWDLALETLRAASGIPTVIGLELPPVPEPVPEPLTEPMTEPMTEPVTGTAVVESPGSAAALPPPT
jgi:L,D-transpeptidase ErfK/SrfK